MPVLVCSMCQSALTDDNPHCPQCGPQSYTLIISEEPTDTTLPDPELARKLVGALGAQYEVVRPLGRGGFAEVYEVRDTALQRRLAVKVLRPDVAWTSGMYARFKQESRAIARLNHPNIVPIHFVGEGEGLVFYVMPFVEGESLAHVLKRRGALEPAYAVSLAIPLLAALHHVHENGLIHRDIKPENVMVDAATGRPMLVDFGIAKSLTGESHTTQSGYVVGTPLYMSPEQALGQPNVDARADVYAMGAMLFQLVTGMPPFDGDTSQEIVGKHLNEPVPVPSSCDRRIPRWLSSIIIRCMAKRPENRYASALAVIHALELKHPPGSDVAITAQRVAQQLNRTPPRIPVATHPMDQEAVTAELAFDEAAPTYGRPAHRSSGMGRRTALVTAILFFAAASWGGYTMREQPSLVIANDFLDTATVQLGGQVYAVPPADSVTVALDGKGALVANWALVRPAIGGVLMGDDLRGTITDPEPAGNVRRRLEPGKYIAPRIVNRTAAPLRISIIRGDLTVACKCLVQPGAASERLGYFAIASDSWIAVADTAGRTVTFGDWESVTRRPNGEAMLEVRQADLVASPTMMAARRKIRLEQEARARADSTLAHTDTASPEAPN